MSNGTAEIARIEHELAILPQRGPSEAHELEAMIALRVKRLAELKGRPA
jgi:hypothetical protein